MAKPTALFIFAAGMMMHPAAAPTAGSGPVFRTEVDVVMLGLSVTDRKGNYMRGIHSSDVRVLENGVEQTILSFEGGGAEEEDEKTPIPTSVFVLFDTSNSMYKIFAREQDAIARFVRSLPARDAVAIYTFSRNLTRMATLGTDHELAVKRLRESVAGDSTALYDSLLLTLRDAARVPGRKVVVVFSNGPDDSSVLAPDHVARVAQDEGIPVYVISGREHESLTAEANRAIARETGGEEFQATNRDLQNAAFAAIRTDLENSYLLTYHPSGDDASYRRIEVKIRNRPECRVRTRAGYTPRSD